MQDDLIIQLLQLQQKNVVAVDRVEELFGTDGFLNLNILGVALDAAGIPPDSEASRDEYGDHFAHTVSEGTAAECALYLRWARALAESRRG